MPAPRPLRPVRGLLATAMLTVLVAGIPWGLIHYIGRPLPRTLPTWPDTETVLLTPMSTGFLLKILACVLWSVWSVFVLGVVRATADEIRGLHRPGLSSAEPLHTLARMLVGAIVVTLLTQRPAAASGVPSPAAVSTSTHLPAGPVAPAQSPPRTAPGTAVEVLPPHDGIYDSLWRIAERTLGDGNRWPQIYRLNHGRPQPDGRALTHPDLIRPGWILHLPDHPTPKPPPPRQPPHTDTPTPPSPSPGTTPPTDTPAPSPSPTADTPGSSGGVSLPSGAYVGIGLAALITAALLTACRRHRVRYRPGSGDRDDLTLAPVVRVLRIAHDTTQPPEPPPTRGETPLAQERVIGVKAGQDLAWNLARSRGLGLIGPGAPDAARALLVTLLAERATADGVELLVPACDIRTLIGNHPHPLTALHVVEDLDTALDMMEAELLLRTRPDDPDVREDAPGPQSADMILVATPAPHADRRLQAVLDNGSTLGLAGILLGQWRPGDTAHVRTDGTVSATNTTAQPLTNTRLFTLPTTDTRDLLDLLHQAHPPAGPRTGPHHPAPDPRPANSAPEQTTAQRRPLVNGPGPRTDQPPDPPPTAPQPTEGEATLSERQQPTPHPPLHLTVLGRTRLTHHHHHDGDEHTDLSPALAPKHREILAYLALHRDGVRRETLTATLWPDAPRDRPHNAFHATHSQLRRTLRTATHHTLTDITTLSDGHYRLDPDQTTVDLWHLQDALNTARHTTGEHRRPALEHVIALYTGDFAADLTPEWTESPREALRRDVLDTFGALVRLLRTDDPEQALTLLEHARTLDRYNEAVYRDIARFQAHLGRHDAVPRTLALLTTTLAEIDDHPSPETLALCTSLQRSPVPGPQ